PRSAPVFIVLSSSYPADPWERYMFVCASFFDVGITNRSSYFAIANKRYICFVWFAVKPTRSNQDSSKSLPEVAARINERIIAIRCKEYFIVAVSTDVRMLDKYSIGIRIASIAGKIISGFLIESFPSK